jgi:hypothetical protein
MLYRCIPSLGMHGVLPNMRLKLAGRSPVGKNCVASPPRLPYCSAALRPRLKRDPLGRRKHQA